jgi:REP element-mobilizing transposase RayT
MTLYKNKYRIETARLGGYDYGQPGWYFVTIVTKNRTRLFGHIIDGVMHLSHGGLIASQCWLAIPEHFPHVSLDECIVMPNHIHGIVVINEIVNDYKTPVETQHFASLRDIEFSNNQKADHSYNNIGNQFGPQSKNLASIIRGFKNRLSFVFCFSSFILHFSSYFSCQPSVI